MRRSLRVRAYAGKRGVSKVYSSPLIPIIKVAVIVIVIAGAGFSVYKWGIPYAKTLFEEEAAAPTPTPIATPTQPPATYAKADMSDLETEIKIPHWFITDPYYYNGKIIYTSGQEAATAPNAIDNLLIYDIGSNSYTRVETPTRLVGDGDAEDEPAGNNYFGAQMNESWIVWLESDYSNRGGGRILAYDRRTNESFVLREYIYGMADIFLSGDYCLFTVATGAKKDKIYLYDLNKQEVVLLRNYNYSTEPFSISTPSICDTEIIWVDAMTEETGITQTTLRSIKIKENLSFDNDSYVFDTYVYNPITNGEAIVFLNTQRSLSGDLMISVGGNDPVVVATGVLNYDLGDHFVAYTKDTSIYVYYWADGSTGQLSNRNSKAILASVSDNVVLWYDITDGIIGEKEKDRDVLMMAEVPFEK
ncbi:MAG: hypothetical protein AB1Z19_02965 [Eubacteriales bacterium]